MRKILFGAVLATLIAVPLYAQGSLSNQVLRLLSRINTWSALQTYDAPNGGVVLLGRQSVPLGTRTDRLENIGGLLYFNGTVLASSSSAGTVTSVALTAPAFLTVGGSPVTAAGTLALTLTSTSAHFALIGPTSGSGVPTQRLLVAGDIPDLSTTYATASNSMAFTNKTGAISQWTNDSSYAVTTATTLSNLTTVGTITTGVWNGTLISGQYGGTGIANTGKTITIGGNVSTANTFTTSGNFPLTLTTTASTNITLPTSGSLISSTVTTLSSLVSIGTITTGTWTATPVGVAYGGTGLSSYTQGDIIYASGTTTLAKLAKSASATRYLSNTGSSNNPAWAQVDLTNGVTGVLPGANGGLSTSIAASTDGQILIARTSDHTLVLSTVTGTSNQVVVTNGAGSITLSTPQSIGTASTPQFARLGLGTGAGATAVVTTTGIFDTGYFDNGNSGTTKTITWTSGMNQKITMNNTCTFTFAAPTASGTRFTLVVIQDGSGSHTVTWPGSVVWKGGSAPTLTTTAGKADIVYFVYNGSTYYGTSDLNF